MPDVPTAVHVNFHLEGDGFPHAWFFNRFRVDRLGDSFLVTLGLATTAGGILAVNAFVLGAADHRMNRDRSLTYLGHFGDTQSEDNFALAFSAPPARVYPVNHINLSRVDQQAEIGLYRFSIKTLAEFMQESKTATNQKPTPVRCYPVVMFRSDLNVQVALVKELYSFEVE